MGGKYKKIMGDRKKIEILTSGLWAVYWLGKKHLRERAKHQKECTICQNEIKNSEEETRKLSRR